jgi:hypothetical protein
MSYNLTFIHCFVNILNKNAFKVLFYIFMLFLTDNFLVCVEWVKCTIEKRRGAITLQACIPEIANSNIG